MIAFAHLQVELKITFIYIPSCNEQPHTMLHLIGEATNVHVVLAPDHRKVVLLLNLLLREEVLVKAILVEVVLQIIDVLTRRMLYLVLLSNNCLSELVHLDEVLL